MNKDERDNSFRPQFLPARRLQKDSWDSETEQETPQSIQISQRDIIPITPTSSTKTIDLALRRRAMVRHHTLQHSTTRSTRTSVTPGLAELIAHREHIARKETALMQAFTIDEREHIARETTRHIQTPSARPEPTAQAAPEKDKGTSRRLFRHKRRVPVLQQISMVECGAACLAMLLSYHGRQTTV